MGGKGARCLMASGRGILATYEDRHRQDAEKMQPTLGFCVVTRSLSPLRIEISEPANCLLFLVVLFFLFFLFLCLFLLLLLLLFSAGEGYLSLCTFLILHVFIDFILTIFDDFFSRLTLHVSFFFLFLVSCCYDRTRSLNTDWFFYLTFQCARTCFHHNAEKETHTLLFHNTRYISTFRLSRRHMFTGQLVPLYFSPGSALVRPIAYILLIRFPCRPRAATAQFSEKGRAPIESSGILGQEPAGKRTRSEDLPPTSSHLPRRTT